MKSYLVLFSLALFGLHCQSSTLSQTLPESQTLKISERSPLAQALPPASFQSEGVDSEDPSSGFLPLMDGSDAFEARVALIDTAVTSLDLQYYIWHRDKTGMVLFAKLLNAAERGVRVRLLLDDMNLGEDREFLAQLSRHPNVEIKLYNPLPSDGEGISKIARGLEVVLDFDRKNRRMHNKVLIADNSFAVIGGRNIGDEYFDLKKDKNFRDLDVLAAGPVSHELSGFFQQYWTSSLTFGLRSKGQDLPKAKGAAWGAIREALKLNRDLKDDKLFAGQTAAKATPLSVRGMSKSLIWAPAHAVADNPEIHSNIEAHGLVDQLKKLPEPKKEFLIESAYFIPPDKLLALFKKFQAQGVKVKILTNSLISNDVLVAHAGYSGKREEILKTGAELYEWRNAFVKVKTDKKRGIYASRAGLHSKAFVIDNEYLFIGSMNLDPRSIDLNTESGVVIKSAVLASKFADFITEGMGPTTSWKVTLSCPQEKCESGKSPDTLKWHGIRDGKQLTLDTEPDASFWKRFLSGGLSLLPIEDKL